VNIEISPTISSAISKPNAMPERRRQSNEKTNATPPRTSIPKPVVAAALTTTSGPSAVVYPAIVGASPIPSRNVNALKNEQRGLRIAAHRVHHEDQDEGGDERPRNRSPARYHGRGTPPAR